ncbi:MAG: response regulator [FCB group bacterium]|nr:response regulator [FCB group bacterium]
MKDGILIVDDDHALTTLFQYYLRPFYGGKITCASNGLEAVLFCRKHTPEIILMDLHMPVMDGLTAIRKLRTMNISCPILVLSSYTFKDGEECLAAGASQVIQKPVREKRFHELIGQFIPIPRPVDTRVWAP